MKWIQCWDEIEHDNSNIIIFGAGKYGKWARFFFEKEGINVLYHFDNNPDDYKYLNDTKLVKPFLCKEENVVVLIAISNSNVVNAIRNQMYEIGYSRLYEINKELLDDEINALPDYDFIKARFRMRMGEELDLEYPKTFNEKLNWIKLYDRNPLYTIMVDKFAVKQYVSQRIGDDYIVPTIGVWDSIDEVPFDDLPEKYVLKCTHDSGSIVICKDKKVFDKEKAKSKLEEALKINYFFADREWPYKNVSRRIICEEFIESDSPMLEVFKVFNFNGEPYLIQVIQNDKTENETIDYFDIDWNLLELRQNFPNSLNHIRRPKVLNELLELARKLSVGIPFVRTDFYITRDRLYFSEFTFFSDSGCERFFPSTWDRKLGDMLKLSREER